MDALFDAEGVPDRGSEVAPHLPFDPLEEQGQPTLQNERYHTGIHVFHFSLSMCAPCSLFLILAFRCVPLLYPMYFFNSMSHGRLRAFF
jgi:hypothetical protein